VLAPAARLLSDYVAIPSVNPMGRSDLDPAITGERRYAEHLAHALRALGVDVELIGSSERPSVIAEVRAPGARERVLVASHLDTVPVDGMTIDPFDPLVRGDWLYGRGACDTKAGMAALVAALAQLLARGKLRRHVTLVGEADEEMSSAGVRDVIAHLHGRARDKVDWALATEPTQLRLVTHHKGRVSARLLAHGRACHSSDPDQGDSAIVSLSRMVIALHELHREKAGRPDPRLGPGTLSVGIVGGGRAPNVVADEAFAIVDWRMLPGETADSVRRELLETAERAGVGERLEVSECSLDKESLATEDDAPPVRACRTALDRCGLSALPIGVAFGTDAGPLSLAGIPSVVMGPGSIAQAHTADEWVALAELEAMQAFFVELLGNASLA
jgi:acetylornithine deacetylase